MGVIEAVARAMCCVGLALAGIGVIALCVMADYLSFRERAREAEANKKSR